MDGKGGNRQLACSVTGEWGVVQELCLEGPGASHSGFGRDQSPSCCSVEGAEIGSGDLYSL